MLYAAYNFVTNKDITYTIDMIRIRTDITFLDYSKLESRLRTIYPDMVKNHYVSTGISDFKYNYNVEIEEGKSFWFGFMHNSELINKTGSLQNDNTKFNFTVEFNPNKLEIKGILLNIIHMCHINGAIIKSVDMAMDIGVNILDIGGFDKRT